MKRLLMMILVAVMFAVPAMGEEGGISDADLALLGLGSMEWLSDADGMDVRGLSLSGIITNVGFSDWTLYDPGIGGVFYEVSDDFGQASPKNAGSPTALSGNLHLASSAFPLTTSIVRKTHKHSVGYAGSGRVTSGNFSSVSFNVQ